jgi:hypothetical protein
MGALYYGDNLEILRRYLGDETVEPGEGSPRSLHDLPGSE